MSDTPSGGNERSVTRVPNRNYRGFGSPNDFRYQFFGEGGTTLYRTSVRWPLFSERPAPVGCLSAAGRSMRVHAKYVSVVAPLTILLVLLYSGRRWSATVGSVDDAPPRADVISIWVSVTKVGTGHLLPKFRRFFKSLVGRRGDRCRAVFRLNVIADNVSWPTVDRVVRDEFDDPTLLQVRRLAARAFWSPGIPCPFKARPSAVPVGPLRFPRRAEDGRRHHRTVETVLPVVQGLVLQRRRVLFVAGAPSGRAQFRGQGHRRRRRHRVPVQRLRTARHVRQVTRPFRRLAPLSANTAALFIEFSLSSSCRCSFTDTQLFGLAPEQSPVYHHILWKWRNSKPDNAQNLANYNGLNSGVILSYLKRIRTSSDYRQLFSPEWISTVVQKYLFKVSVRAIIFVHCFVVAHCPFVHTFLPLLFLGPFGRPRLVHPSEFRTPRVDIPFVVWMEPSAMYLVEATWLRRYIRLICEMYRKNTFISRKLRYSHYTELTFSV